MKKNSFVEGTVIATAIIIIVKLLGMLYVIPFYKIVGDQGGALYSYGYNIYLLFLGISSAGLPDAIAKIISEYNALGYDDAKQRAYKIGRDLILGMAVISFFLLMVFAEEIGAFIIGDLKDGNTIQDVAFVVRCVAPSVLLIPFLSITKGYLQGHKFISASSMSQLIEQVFRITIILIGSYLVIKVFKGGISLAVGIAMTGAFFGGLFAYLYLKYAMNKNKEELKLNDNVKEDKITNKEITKKILTYALPFIIINIVSNIYNSTDQILVLRTLEYLKLDTKTVEFCASAISTWSPKICMVINAMAMGMTMSLVPTIVSAYAKKDFKEVEDKINKSLSMIFFISIPLSIGISFLSESVWTAFYGYNKIGGTILKLMAFSALFGNLYMIVSTICQSLNKYSAVYKVSVTGFMLNALLDVPIMLLYNRIGLPVYLGSITASIIGYSTSVVIGLILLRKENKYSYKKAVTMALKSLIPALSMLFVLILLRMVVSFSVTSRLTAVLNIAINAIVGGIVYIFISIKAGLLDEIIGRHNVAKIVRKLTFGLIKIKDAS